MANQAGWQKKIYDEPRVGFVDQFGSREKRAVPAPQHPPEPPPPPPSPLDKVLDERRRGFVAEQREINARHLAGRHERWTK